MRFNRRAFLAMSAAAPSLRILPVQAAAHGPGIRQTITDFAKDAAKVKALKDGVATMKSRKPSDPTSWFYQASIHAVQREWVDEAAKTDPAVTALYEGGKVWNQCPHFTQPRSDFTGWHRAYTFHFENILRDASGDGDLMLPYWDYLDPSQRTLPQIYADPEMQGGQPTNPLYEFFRDDSLKRGGSLSAFSVGNGDLNSKTDYFGIGTDTQFGGSPLGNRSGTGAMESRPHNQMHGALGGTVILPNGDRVGGYMGSVPTAAFDPIFWIHHTNCDRLWTVWDCKFGKDWGRLPNAGWFDEAPWLFHNPDGTDARETRKFYIEHGVLPVTYDDVPPGCDPLSGRIPVLVAGAAESMAQPEAMVMPVAEFTMAEEAGPGMLALDAPNTTTLTLGAPEASPMNALESLGVAEPEKVFLDLLDIQFAYTPSVRYDVYVNAESDADLVPDSEAHVGSLDFFALSAQVAMADMAGGDDGGLAASFDVTDRVTEDTSMSDLKVQIVAEDQVVDVEGGERSSGDVQVGKMRLRRVSGGDL